MAQIAQNREDNELNLQLLNKDDIQQEDGWLSDQFSRFPFLIYKFCLVVTFIIALGIQPSLILCQFNGLVKELRIWLALVNIGSILVLPGCVEMLIAMTKRRSEFAQKSLVKLKYSLVTVILGLITLRGSAFDFNKSVLFEMAVNVALPVSILIDIVGGLAVIRTFKKNAPFQRLQASQDANPDFLEQNEVIASEILKYDKQLNRWPYKVYRSWLKFVIALTIVNFAVTLMTILTLWSSLDVRRLAENLLMLIMFTLIAFCCYKMEVVLRTKQLEKSKQALSHLKTCFLVIIILATIDVISVEEFVASRDLVNFGVFILLPLITFIGALKIHKIIEQRDQFAKVSSYSGDHYL